MRLFHGHTAEVMAVAFSPDGRMLASAGWDGSIRLWNLAGSGDSVCLHTGNDHTVAVAWSPDGEYLAAGFRTSGSAHPAQAYGNAALFLARPRIPGGAIEIRPEDTWNPHSGTTQAVRFSPSSKRLATLGYTGHVVPRILFWDISTRSIAASRYLRIALPKQRRRRFGESREPLSDSIRDFRYCPDGTEMAGVVHYRDGGLVAWDFNLPSSVPKYHFHISGDCGNSLEYSPDGVTVVGGFESGRLVWWQPGEQNAVGIQQAHKSAVRSVAYSTNGRSILSAGADGLVKIWDARTRGLLRTFDWQLGDIGCVAVAPDGLTAAAGGNGVIVVWDLDE